MSVAAGTSAAAGGPLERLIFLAAGALISPEPHHCSSSYSRLLARGYPTASIGVFDLRRRIGAAVAWSRRAAHNFNCAAAVTRVYGSTEVPVTTVGSPRDPDHAAETDGRPGFAAIALSW